MSERRRVAVIAERTTLKARPYAIRSRRTWHGYDQTRVWLSGEARRLGTITGASAKLSGRDTAKTLARCRNADCVG